MVDDKAKEIVIHFGEIWLKGRNRGSFVKRLYENVALSLKGEKVGRLEHARDRFILHLDKKSDVDSIENRLAHVFGISWFARVLITTTKPADILRVCSSLYKKGESVRVEAKRSFKGLRYNSQELIGLFLKNKGKMNFTLDKDAGTTLYINLTKDNAIIHKNKVRGLGGLPVGVSGKTVVLLSGGIDSPVASFYAMKKGLVPIYLHMHAFPTNEEAMKSKMGDILKNLSVYYPKSKAYFVPSYLFQTSIMKVPHQHELVLFKRFLYKLAEKIAEKEGAEVLTTGESLGQVASQTVKNLIATEHGGELLTMRPLIGFDKQEIIDKAKELGTYGLSIKKYPDVCSLRAQNPSTATRREEIDKLWKREKLDVVMKKTLIKGGMA